MVGFDYQRRIVELTEPFFPTGNIEADLERMKSFFEAFKGKYPEQGVL